MADTGRFFVNIEYAFKGFAEASRFIEDVPKGLLNNLTPFWEQIKPIVQKSVANSYATEGHGKWQKLSDIYLKSKKKRESPYPTAILKLTGKMWKASTQEGAEGNVEEITKNRFVWGVDLDAIPYARRHDMGDVGGKPIAQREFLRLYPEDTTEINEQMENYVRAGIIKLRNAAFKAGYGK